MKATRSLVSAKRQKRLFILLFTVPTFLFYALFAIYPMCRGLYLSFFDWSGGSEHMNFIGLDNYRELVHDPIIPKAIANDYFLVMFKVIGILLLALFFAVSLTRLKVRGAGFLRVVFFFPNVISVVVIGVLWRYIYNPSIGFLNSFLSLFTASQVQTPWLGDAQYAMTAILVPSIWAGIGFYMLLLIAGILSIPKSLYEASNIDGATQWQQFRHVTIPLVWEQLSISVLHIVVTTLNGSFIIVSIMTEGGPDNATQVMGYYLYQMAFKQFHLSYGAAIGVMILVLSLITVVILQRLMRRDTVEMV